MRNGNDLKCSVNWLIEYVGCAKLALWNGIPALQFADTRREPKSRRRECAVLIPRTPVVNLRMVAITS